MCPQTIAIAAGSFVAGMIVSALIAKARCGKKNGSCKCGAKKSEPHEEHFAKTHPAPADGSIEIYVGNLSYDMTEDQLREAFAACGKVNSARIIINKYNGKSKGFGFVQMPDPAEADKAVKELNDKEILGRRIKCNIAKNVVDA